MEHRCSEVLMAIGDAFIRCHKDARTRVAWRDRTEGPYWLCPAHADHYLRNRGAIDVTPPQDDAIPSRQRIPDHGF
jgi:hypothetical protein